MEHRIHQILATALILTFTLGACQQPEMQVQECENVLPGAVTEVEWEDLTPGTIELWVEENFSIDASQIVSGTMSDIYGAFVQFEWEADNNSYVAQLRSEDELSVISYYFPGGGVPLKKWLECVGEPTAFRAEQVQYHRLENQLALYYPTRGIIVSGTNSQANTNRIDENFLLSTVLIVRPSQSLRGLIAPTIDRSALESRLSSIRPWAGAEGEVSIIVD